MNPLAEQDARRAGPDVMAWLDRVDDPPTNMIRTLIRQPRLLKYWLRFGGELFDGSLPPELRCLVILRVAARRRCIYEWVHHVGPAQQLGWQNAQLETLVEPLDPGQWDRRSAIVLRAVDVLLDEHRLNAVDVDSLSAEITEAGVVELILLIGHYELAATLASSLGVGAEPSLADTRVPW